jgi:hypothetical protein
MGERMYGSTFLELGTSSKWAVSFTLRRFTTEEGGADAPEWFWTLWRRENSWPYRDSYSDPSVVQPVASCYIDRAIPGPYINKNLTIHWEYTDF